MQTCNTTDISPPKGYSPLKAVCHKCKANKFHLDEGDLVCLTCSYIYYNAGQERDGSYVWESPQGHKLIKPNPTKRPIVRSTKMRITQNGVPV